MAHSDVRRMLAPLVAVGAVLALTTSAPATATATAEPSSAGARKLARTVTLDAAHTAVGVGARVKWTGRVRHTPKRSRVLVQRRAGDRWVRVASTRTRDASGRFKVFSVVGTKGRQAFRALAPASRKSGHTLRKAKSARVVLAVSPWTSVTHADGGWVGCGIRVDHSMWCWGLYVGNGTYGKTHVDDLVRVPGRWRQASAGPFNACAVKTDGSAWCWGDGGPQIGNGATGWAAYNRVWKRPQRVVGGASWRQVAMGEDHACGIKADGTAWCWGSRQNDSDSPSPYNQLGDGDQSAQGSAIPVAVDGGATWRSIEVNGSRTCGIKVDGSAWCWGANSLVDASNAADYRGALGTGNTANALVPTAVSGGGTWRELSLGRQHTCGVRADHTLWCWGNNATAQLGDGTTKARRLVPTAVASGGRWLSVAVNDATSCALRDDRSAWCWGSNTFGQLGDGTGLHTGSSDEGLRFQRRPLEIAYPRSWAMLAEPGLGIRRGGSIWRWGAIDTVVQVGDGSWSGSYYIQTTPMPSHW